MWSPVAAFKRSFRKTSDGGGDDSSLPPPPALLNVEDLVEDNNNNEERRSRPRTADATIFSPVAAFKKSFRKSKSSSSASVPGFPEAPLSEEEDLQDANNDLSNRDDDAGHDHDESDGHHQQSEAAQQDGGQNNNNNNTSHPDDPNGKDDGEYDPNQNPEDEGTTEKGDGAPSGFNTRLSGFNTRLLADIDLDGEVDDDDDDDDDEEDDDNYGEDHKKEEEFDFAGESDDDLIDRAFFGVDVSESDDDMEFFNEWYLRDDEEGFLAPILFEDGMNSDECDLYYISLEEDKIQATNPSPHGIAMARRSLPTQFRSALPLRRLEEEEEDELPSSLRKPKKRSIQQEIVPLRRRSFGGLPGLPENPEFYRPHSCPDLSTLHSPHLRPKVNFDTEVQVVTVFAAYDYPRKIRSTLWFSKKQIRASRKEASRERRKERRQREKDEAAGRGTF